MEWGREGKMRRGRECRIGKEREGEGRRLKWREMKVMEKGGEGMGKGREWGRGGRIRDGEGMSKPER